MIFRARLTVLLILVPLAQASAQRHVLTIDTPTDGMRILASGDTIRLRLHREECSGDVCQRLAGAPVVVSWQSNSDTVASVSASGLLTGRSPGTCVVTASTAAGTGTGSVRVLPAVRDIVWSTRQRFARVGDTLHVSVLARDSAGRVVARIAPDAHIGGTGKSGVVVNWDTEGGTAVIFVDRPGLLVLAGRLAHRTDTLRIEARRDQP
jgi:hypothetical protein